MAFPKHLLCGLCLILTLFLPSLACTYEGTFFVIDSGQLTRVDKGTTDAVDLRSVEEWQIRLYRNNQSPVGSDNWGLISEKTADKAMATLKREQDFQIRYAKFIGTDYRDETLTYFNPLGPIAVLKPLPRPKPLLTKMAQEVERMNELLNGFHRIADILSDKPKGTNPFSGIGNSVMEYGKNTFQAVRQLNTLQQALRESLGHTEAQLGAELDDFARDLQRLESTHASLQKSLSREGAGGGTWANQTFTLTTAMEKPGPLDNPRLIQTVSIEGERILIVQKYDRKGFPIPGNPSGFAVEPSIETSWGDVRRIRKVGVKKYGPYKATVFEVVIYFQENSFGGYGSSYECRARESDCHGQVRDNGPLSGSSSFSLYFGDVATANTAASALNSLIK